MIEVVIEDLVYGGKGLARMEGKVVFVPRTIPGERVSIRLLTEHKRYSEAELVEVLCAAPQRIEPACALFAACPGCCYQHVDYPEEVRLKARQLADFMEHRVGAAPEVWLSPVPAPGPLEYRNKLTLHAGRAKGMVLGYYGFDNTRILDVARCPLAVPALNRMLATLRSDHEFIGRLSGGDTVTLRHTVSAGAVSWIGSAETGKTFTERTAIGEFDVPMGSFFQINIAVADLIFRQVGEILGELEPDKVIDPYCGVGVFAIVAAQAGIRQVFGSDRDGLAIEAARRNASRLNAGSVRFAERTAFESLRELLDAQHSDRVAVVLDPPRTGLEPRVADIICGRRPSNVVYVSCAADTLARDLAKFTQSGYRLTKAGMFDMFPRTAHFESVSVLEWSGR